ncbi:MipA/OmpV family protein [Massilia sp. AB1]|uniref:MipA/OmpV family protein n=1 Tax=Massilia sp. AB1 TaxID=2823371 RepID=UPI001B8388E7|nr:MipA/OmpV family protein [Massilia sp. AB1]MBQ5942628.1 MipA/OmpV family protein [Massilia sp. AB1]
MFPFLKAAFGAAILSASAAAAAQSDERHLPLWEIGIGAAGISTPAYPGADDRSSRLLALPFILYRGEVLRADQSGIGARLFHSDRVEFDVGLAGALPSDSDDVEVRAGMPDLGTLLEFGPRLKVKIADLDRSTRLRAELPLRAVIEVRGGLRQQGWTFEPRLVYERVGEGGAWTFQGQLSAVVGNERIQRYFYEVAPQYANAARPAYAADAGLMLTRVGVFGTRRINRDLRLFGFLRFESYHGAANRDSPLHLRDTGVSGGVGFAWTWKRSSRRASGTETISPASL